ncbi:hypothetical protein CLV63_12376 [Murinocardiopsis flavida]|uniref:Uncharacterized protein n=1 Tax=Murinocardiopsis flavida TaxID=645275 RepID=A0A2P8CZ81_9ACTN|nr:hypothetical protein [Murinocardiopsis flavida]PSK90247.1 hypothetical protein CLV63_12376 [Murinocardiopsis flavida]
MASVNARFRSRARRSESGVSVIEYAAMIVLAGVIMGGAGLYLLGDRVAKHVPPALCVLLSAGQADCDGEGGGGDAGPKPPHPSPTAGPCSDGRPGTKKDDAFKPPLCEKLYEKEYSKSTYKMLFIKITDEFAFIRQEYSDGTVRLTALSTGHLGVEVESGLNVFKSGGVEVGGKIGGGLNMAVGDTYVFKNKGEADDKIGEIKSYYNKVRQEQGRAQTKFCADNPIMSSCKVSDPPDMDDPQITTKSVGGEGSGGLKLGNITDKKDKKGDKGKKDDKDDEGGDSLSLNLLGGEGKMAGETIEEKDNRDPKNPKTSKIYSFTVSGEGTAGLLHGKGSKNVSLKVTHDKDGKLVGIVMSEAVESPRGEGFNLDVAGQVGPVNGSYGKTERKGRYDVRTAQLEVTDKNRSVVEDWLTGQKSGAGDLADEVGEPVDINKDSTDWDKVKKEFYDHGKVSKVLYDTEFESESVGWGVSFLGMEFGVAAEWGREGRESIAADFLGAPDGKNPRDWVDFPECVHKDGGDDGKPPPPPPPPPGCPTKKD